MSRAIGSATVLRLALAVAIAASCAFAVPAARLGAVFSPSPTCNRRASMRHSGPTVSRVVSAVDSRRHTYFGKGVIESVGLPGQNENPDDNGHGTLVAGVAAGSSTVHSGAAPNAKLVSLRVVNASGAA